MNENKKETEDIEMILAQWQTCVEMANSVSQRRDAMNNIFITVNLAITAAVSITWDIKSVFLLIAGVVLCFLWKMFIVYYKLLNKTKFEVIQELELRLPAAPFTEEWKLLCKTKEYKDATKLEVVLPITFIGLYVVAIISIMIIRFMPWK